MQTPRFLKALVLVFIALVPAAASAQPDYTQETTDGLVCVPQCLQRSITGMCTNFGSDFCTPYEGTACIPHCVDRSINLMCTSYGIDFCAVYPACQPYCVNRSVNGQCLQYGEDACVGY